MKVEVQMKGGKIKMMTPAQARAMVFIGRGQYLTRDMQAEPQGIRYRTEALVSDPQPKGVQVVNGARVTDDLDAMDAPALHALAKERGVKVHHASGAEKVRAALRAAE